MTRTHRTVIEGARCFFAACESPYGFGLLTGFTLGVVVVKVFVLLGAVR